VETAGNRNLQTRIYKQEIQLYKLLESDKQAVGPVSTQAPLDWRLSEWGDEFIEVYTDANIVMGAESFDFFFNCRYLKVITVDGIWYVPGGIHY
jgi:hypothetical protein